MTPRDVVAKLRRLLVGDVREAVYRSLLGPSRAIDLGLAEPAERVEEEEGRRCPE
jgi:hypothetical protein